MSHLQSIREDMSLSKKNKTRLLILESSVELFLDVGYPKASMRDIAASAGIKAGSMFYHFKDKDELLYVIMERTIKTILAVQQENYVKGAAVQDRLRSLIKSEVASFLNRTPGVSFQVLIHEWRHLSQDHADKLMILRDVYEINWQETLQECFEKKLMQASPKIVRRILNGAFAWINYWYKAEGEMTIDEIVDEVQKMLILAI